jgi:adenosine deaminase
MSAAPATTAHTTDFWRSLPKVLLHEHLDGGLRPGTLLALCQAYQGRLAHQAVLPAATAPEVVRWLQGNAQSGSLERYVAAFAPTVAAMASAAACEQVAFEAAEDARLDGCVLAEFRMAPLLLEPHGLAPEAAIEALLRGLQRSAMPAGLIVCAMRTDSAQQVERAARLAVQFASHGSGHGVVGFDLAGAEHGYPATRHRRAIDIARAAGLGITLHAGEADGGHRVLEAIELGATRIGHGVHIARATQGDGKSQDASAAAQRMAQVAALRVKNLQGLELPVHFEVCPTSNTHTGVCSALASHPLPAMLAAGLDVSVHTDNRLISGVTHTGELAAVHAALGLSAAQLARSMVSAAQASFMPQEVRDGVIAQIVAWQALHIL